MGEHECPTCGDTFDTKRGCSIHQSHAHSQEYPWQDEDALREYYVGRELSTREIADEFGCAQRTIMKWLNKHGIETRQCLVESPSPKVRNEETLRRLYKEEGLTVSQVADRLDTHSPTVHRWLDRHDIETRSLEGEDHPMWNGGNATLQCDQCDKEISKKRSEVGERNFCSPECLYEWQSEEKSGEDNHLWAGGKVETECENCGATLKRWPSDIKAVNNSFCDGDCFGSWVSENRTGEDHPRWVGGHARYYGPSWYEQRQRARDRDDYRCQICGASDEVHVHHIRPFREFGVENHEEANALDNLICLCPHHHTKWEGIPLRPDTGDATAD